MTIKLIVGIGASAGGLKALEAFFSAVPRNSGCCFVVVQHLSPNAKSIMDELLGRHTSLPTYQVEEGMPASADAIFLIPPKKLITLHDGFFGLSDRDITTVAEMPIDVFFKSLANEVGSRAVGVVLSGAGLDGAAGLRAIEEAGGLVIVQKPETADFDSMPRSALAATLTAQALRSEEMPAIIVAHTQAYTENQSRQVLAGGSAGVSNEEDSAKASILALLRRVSGIDFTKYKFGTIGRRMEHRMQLRKRPDLGTYANLLATDPEELEALYGDVLIGVTDFFRDAEAFAWLQERIVPGLLAANPGREVRIWVTACATGEEAYSIAILFDEVAVSTGFTGTLSIFATDVHGASLHFASAGLYGKDQLKNVSGERLSRYFHEETAGAYRIVPEIRRRLVFALHNLINDPPFTKLDLVTCRNLLIYFEAALHERVMRLFHFSLREGGCLFLGPSECIGQWAQGTFETLDARLKLFRKTAGLDEAFPRLNPPFNTRPPLPPTMQVYQPPTGTGHHRKLLAAYDQILSRHAPAGLLIDDTYEILHYFGRASGYLTPLEGRAHKGLFSCVEGDLRLALSTLLPRVFKSGEAATSRDLLVAGPEGEERIDVVAEPVAEGRAAVALVHIAFVNLRPALMPKVSEASTEVFVAKDELLKRIDNLEIELLGARENLQTAVEELQASNEELQAGNEELIASNEELQSTNEELHATNDQLYALNVEFERKNTELQLLNDDLNNLSNSTDTGTVFVDRELRIRKFNPAIERIFRLLPHDIGRPIDHIACHIDGQEQMLRDVSWVLQHGELRQREVRTQDKRWLLQRVLPFLTAKGAIGGVVITFTDIDETKAIQMRLNLAMVTSRMVWWDWNLVSDQFVVHCVQECFLGYASGTLPATGLNWQDYTHSDDLSHVRAALQSCLAGTANDWTCEHRLRMAQGAWRWVLNSGMVTERDGQGRPVRMLGTTQDIHERHCAQETVLRDAELLSKVKDSIVCTDLEGVINYWNDGATKLYGWTAEERLGRSIFECVPAFMHELVRNQFDDILRGSDFHGEKLDYRKDGSSVPVEIRVSLLTDAAGKPTGAIGVAYDITTRKQEEQERRRLEQQLFQAHKMETMGTLAGGIAHDFNNIIAAILGFTELALMQAPEDAPYRQLHDGVLRAAHRARDLVKRILSFSRFHEPERGWLDISELLKDAVKFIRATLPSTVELRLDIKEGCPNTLADPNQLHQVLLNLATNAAHAMRERGGILTLHLKTVEFTAPFHTALGVLPAGPFLVVAVADSGHGIDDETLKKIFDPFFTTKPVGEGTGLGLSIVHGIMQGHGGGIDVTSAIGVGTTFTLYLPILGLNNADCIAPVEKQTLLKPGKRHRIAVIDDETDVAMVTKNLLQNLGYIVSCFHSAEDFHNKFSAGTFPVDLIITDQTMPRLTGLQLIQKLRAAGHELPILIVSGYNQDFTPEVLGSLGRTQLLKKPCALEQLSMAVHRALQIK